MEGIITLLTLKNLNNLRKFNNFSDQKEIFKGLETLIKYICYDFKKNAFEWSS